MSVFGRVTTMSAMQSSARNLQLAATQFARAQERASSLRALEVPSDDPAATAQAMRVRSAQRANAQYARNIQDGNGWLSTVDAALSSTSSLLQRARDLTVQGANDGAMSPTQKDAIAAELSTIRDLLLKEANASYLGRSVFAGTSNTGVAFDTTYAYSGGAGQVLRRLDDSATVRVDADGAAAFGTGASSVFATIDAIVSDLRSGVSVTPRIAQLDAHRQAALDVQAAVGARHTTVLQSADRNLAAKIDLEANRARLEDVDVAQAATELSMQQVAQQAAIAATARALRPTLMDFLK